MTFKPLSLSDESRPLLPDEDSRVKPLKGFIEDNGIDFQYFTTITYHFKNTNYKSVCSDNKRIRRVLKGFFGHDVKILFFVERHTDNEEKCYGGYHKHLLIHIPEKTWSTPRGGLTRYLEEFNSEYVCTSCFGAGLSKHHKIQILNRVIQRECTNVPNGRFGKTGPVIYLDGVLAYCTKQFCKFMFGKKHLWDEVIDVSNSDIDYTILLKAYGLP